MNCWQQVVPRCTLLIALLVHAVASYSSPCALEFPKLFSSAECDEIVKAAAQMKRARATLLNANGVDSYMPLDRDGIVAWLPLGRFSRWRWVRMRMEQALTAGERAWQLSADGLASNTDVQVSTYPVGGHYTWHTDSEPPYGPVSAHQPTGGAEQWADKDRRVLSITVQLTPSEQYTGGQVELAGHGNASVEQGTVIMFPSFLPHIVHPVTSGVRQSIVGWFKGEWAEKAALDIKGRWPDRHAAVHDAHAWLNATFADHGRLSLGIAQTHELALQHVDDIRYQQSVLAVGQRFREVAARAEQSAAATATAASAAGGTVEEVDENVQG